MTFLDAAFLIPLNSRFSDFSFLHSRCTPLLDLSLLVLDVSTKILAVFVLFDLSCPCRWRPPLKTYSGFSMSPLSESCFEFLIEFVSRAEVTINLCLAVTFIFLSRSLLTTLLFVGLGESFEATLRSEGKGPFFLCKLDLVDICGGLYQCMMKCLKGN